MTPLFRLVVCVACLSVVIVLCSAFSPPPKPFRSPAPGASLHARRHHPRLQLHVLDRSRQAPAMHKTLQMGGDHNAHDFSEGTQHQMNPAVSVLGKSTSTFVSLTFFAFLALRRDAYMVSFFIGAISNGILSKVLKKILNHDRPEALDFSEHIKFKPRDGGMPSSHAMSLGFIGTYTALGVVESMPWLVGFIVPYILLSLYYRVKSSLHTIEQVTVGLVLGVTNGVIWRGVSLGTSPLFPSANIMGWVSNNLLPESGQLSPIFLLIPAAVGVAVVGSFERKISSWLKEKIKPDGKRTD
mmetsp:Transcript_21906/g.62854  ORF Transcript_21906/g.62854 Transcript_21906/m.62854 type:complete len:298 (+) Transcript_21906:81-974(+)